LNRAVKWQIVPRNVVTLTDAPRQRQDEPQVLTPEQAGQLLAAAEGTPEQRLYVVLLSTGLRISEALGLTWRDVSFEARTLNVAVQLERGADPGRVELKTKGSKRLLPLTPQAVLALMAQRAVSRQQRLECPVAWAGEPADDYCFSNEAGRPWSANLVLGKLKRQAKRAGLPESTHLHTLRHSCATYLLAAGVPDRVVMSILGHASLRMTSHYQHVLNSMLTEAADALSRVFPVAAVGS
jgi:integrase